MQGIDWNGLPVIVDMLGIKDIEMLIYQLIVIREHFNVEKTHNRDSL